jgi:hypothetical protein
MPLLDDFECKIDYAFAGYNRECNAHYIFPLERVYDDTRLDSGEKISLEQNNGTARDTGHSHPSLVITVVVHRHAQGKNVQSSEPDSSDRHANSGV